MTKTSERIAMKKSLKRFGLGILLIIVLLVIIFIILYFNVLRTMLSVKQIGKKSIVYQERIYGNCWFDQCVDANVKTRNELTDFLVHNIGYGLLDNIDFSHGCSAFFARTPNGDFLLCNDVDHDSKDRTPVVMEAEILGKSTIGYADMVSLAKDTKDNFYNRVLMYMMPYTMLGGINEDGLAIGIAAAKGSFQKPDKDKENIYDSMVSQLLLSKAATVEEAIHYLEKFNVGAGSYRTHYMLADAEGNSAIVEWNGDMKVFYPENDYLIMTNFPIYNGTGFGKDRYDNYEEALAACKGVLTEQEAMELLKANRIEGDEFVSVVYNLTKKTARMYFEKADQEIVYSFD